MARQPVGLPGLNDALTARAHQWAEQSCLDQHLPTKITDPVVLGEVASLLGAGPAGVRRQAPAAGTAPAQEAA